MTTLTVTMTNDETGDVTTTRHNTLPDALDTIAGYAARGKYTCDLPDDAAVIAFECIWWDDSCDIIRLTGMVPRR